MILNNRNTTLDGKIIDLIAEVGIPASKYSSLSPQRKEYARYKYLRGFTVNWMADLVVNLNNQER